MKKIYQDKFGNGNDEPENMGNCYPACVATLLSMELHEVPHFHAMGMKWEEIWSWLRERGVYVMPMEWPLMPEWHTLMTGTFGVFDGESPRFEDGTLHAVVGEITEGGWKLLHDPHPEGNGFSGEPKYVEIFHMHPFNGRAAELQAQNPGSELAGTCTEDHG